MKLKLLLALSLMILAITSRLLPHPDNFVPIAAIALFAGAILPLRLALTLPLGAMIISDFIIGLHSLFLLTWGCFLLVVFLGKYLIRKIKPISVITASLAASVLFYLITNFGVWAEGRMYSMTISGLIECYYMALPFFRHTILSDLFYSGLLFGAYASLRHFINSGYYPGLSGSYISHRLSKK